MKGSTGWIILGVIVIFVLFVIVRLYYHDAMSYKLKHQNIVFAEVEILKVKNTLLLAEKSLPFTWNLSVLREIFDAGVKGFGSEFWHKINPADKSEGGKIPSTEEIKSYIEMGLNKYRGFNDVDDFNGVGLATSVRPDVTLGDAKITAKVSGRLKTFAGDEKNPLTQSEKRVEAAFSYLVQFKKIVDAGKLLAAGVKISPFTSNGNAYKSQVEASILSQFGAVSPDLDKKFTLEKSRLLVPSQAEAGILAALSGLVYHYLAEGQFTEKQALYHYLDENKFEKKPFSLTVKAEDYLVALDCATNNGRLFTFSAANDMACDRNKIYTCNTFIEGIGGNQLACSGRTGASGNFGCGEEGFKDESRVDDSPCYCSAFGRQWLPYVPWVCSKTVKKCDAAGSCTTEIVTEHRWCRAECYPRNLCQWREMDCSDFY